MRIPHPDRLALTAPGHVQHLFPIGRYLYPTCSLWRSTVSFQPLRKASCVLSSAVGRARGKSLSIRRRCNARGNTHQSNQLHTTRVPPGHGFYEPSGTFAPQGYNGKLWACRPTSPLNPCLDAQCDKFSVLCSFFRRVSLPNCSMLPVG